MSLCARSNLTYSPSPPPVMTSYYATGSSFVQLSVFLRLFIFLNSCQTDLQCAAREVNQNISDSHCVTEAVVEFLCDNYCFLEDY